MKSHGIVPLWHPLQAIDQLLLAFGWTNEGAGWLPPKIWRKAMQQHLGGGASAEWSREHAIVMLVRYLENTYPFSKPNEAIND